MPIIAMTREMGSLGTAIGQEAARALGYEFLRNDLIAGVARQYRVREAGLVGTVEERPRLLERLGTRSRRYAAYLEAAVLEAAERERVVLVGRWSTVFLHGVRHAIRVRVCAPVDVRARRVMARLGVDRAAAGRRIAAYDEGVRARMHQMFGVDWTDPTRYDLVISTESMGVASAVAQLTTLAAAAEFQPTEASRADLRDRALGARVRATLKASAELGGVDLDIQARGGTLVLAGVVGTEAERDRALTAAREVPGVSEVRSEVKVFRRPIR